jgi:hypothetical protein
MENLSIPHVEYFNGEPERYPVCIRTILNGHGGEGIVIARNWEEWDPYDDCNWSYWYKFEYELGVHLLGGNVVRIFKKVLTGGVTPGLDDIDDDPEFPIRNSERGWHFSLRNPSIYPKLHALTEMFYERFPIEFTRLDIGWDSVAHIYRIIEANSAPGMTENANTASAYIEFLKERIVRNE